MESKPTGQQIIERLLHHPENWELRLSAAVTLASEGRAGEAVAILDAAPNAPDSEPELLQCAELYAQTQPIKAVHLLHGWLQTYPNSAIVHLAMADTALRLGDHPGAQAYYQRAIQIQPEYRDPDLETRYGLTPASAPIAPAPAAPAAPLPQAEKLDPDSEAEIAAAKPTGRSARKGSGSPLGAWITVATATGVFVLGWLVVALALRAMLGH